MDFQERKSTYVINLRDSEAFLKDASNGLSYQKMKHVYEKRHPLMVDPKSGKKKHYPCCATRMGWHCCLKKWRKSDVRDLGVGVSVYFKMLKFFMALFLFFSVLAIPECILYFFANEQGIESYRTLNDFLSAFTLGNIGECKCS